MKKTIIIAGFILLGFAKLSAQVSFRPGLRAGVNFSSYYNYDFLLILPNFNVNNTNKYTNLTGANLGIYGALKLSKHYTLQPEINFSQQGSKITSINQDSKNIEISYLSLVMINKITFKDKFNIQFGPTIDFMVHKNFDVNYKDLKNEADLALVIGTGYNINKNIGLEARFKCGFITVFEDPYPNNSTISYPYDSSDSDYYSYSYLNNITLSLGATYTFDVK